MKSSGNTNNNDTIDIGDLLKKIASKWYYFLLSLAVFGGIALVYVQFAEKKYEVASSIYVKNMDVGSVEAGQLITPNPKEAGGSFVALTNEISKLTSYSLIKSTMEQLNYGMSYYNVETFWPNFMRESWLNEIGEFPFQITIDSAAHQMVNTPIFIKLLPDDKVHIYAAKGEGFAYNFEKESGSTVNDYELDEVVSLDEPLQSAYLNITVSKKEGGHVDPDYDYCYKLSVLHDLAMAYQGKLTVEPLDVIDAENRMLLLHLNESLPGKGIAFLNALINQYSNQNLNKKNSRGQNSVEFLNEQIARVKDSMDVAAQALENFKSESGVIGNYESSSNLVMGNLVNLEQTRAETQQRLNYYQNTLQGLKNSNGSTAIMAPSAAGINQDPLFNRLVEQYIEIATRLNKLRATATESNPLVTQLKTEAESLREAIVDNLISSISVEKSNLADVNRRIASLKSDMSTLPGEERKLQLLQREHDNLVVKYNELLNTKEKAQLALATNTDNVEIVDAPKKIGYQPVEPNSKVIFSIAFGIGIMIPLALILIKDMANNNIRDKKELESQTKAPLLGMIANGPKDAKLITHKYPNSAIAESFKFARINLQYFHQNSQEKVIGITSSISGEGKTFCSANLSATFAESGKRTILVCCDLRKPKIQDYFNLRGPGISEYLSELASVEDIVQPTDIRNLDVIAPGVPQEDPIRMFESFRMDHLMEELSRRYDYIIVETPPIGYVADYFVLLKHFNINLFVVRYNYTNKNILSGINDLYINNKIKNLYLLFNDVRFSAEYGYGYLSNSDGYYTNTYVRKLNGKQGKLKNPFNS